jgi:signal transduction histidine kinase
VVFLQEERLEGERRERGALVAEAAASGVDGLATGESVDELLRRYEIAGLTSGAVLVESGEAEDFAPPGGDSGDWFLRRTDSGALLAVRLPPVDRGAGDALMLLLGAMSAILLLLVVYAPSYVSRNLTGPLAGLLADAGRAGAGDGSAVSAKASFTRLVEMLAQRDAELENLRSIAEKRADMAELSASTIISAMRSSVLALDDADCLVAFNGAAAELFGLLEEDLGRPFPGARTALGAAVAKILGGGASDVEEFEHTEAGEVGERVLAVSVSRSREGMTAILATDVSRLRTLERRLAEEAVLAGLGTASAGIAHEMGNTLCALSGFIDLLARGRTDERAEALIAEARAEVRSALRMIDSFKMLSSVPQNAGSMLDIAGLAESAGGWAAAAGGPVEVEAGVMSGTIRADRELLDRAVINLLRNARDADPAGSILLSVSAGDGNLRIVVGDRGQGLPPDPSGVLRPFFSTKKDQGHMGMGLTLARRIAMSFGGDLKARARPGGGAEFEIVVPLQGGTS